MAISLASLRRPSRPKPPILLVYGTHKIGKTTLAAHAPDAVAIQTEDGLGDLNVPGWQVDTYADVMDAVSSLYNEDHPFKTLIVDSLDHLEPKVWQHTSSRLKIASIESLDYGKAYIEADNDWRDVFAGFKALRDDKGMAIIMIAHAQLQNFKSPTTEPFDRYVIKLHKRASALVQEIVDGILFVNHRVSVVKDGATTAGKGGHARGVGGGTRVVYTEERPAFVAGRRAGLMIEPAPDMIDLPDDPTQSWATLAQHLTYYSATNTNAALAAE
jgi:hypothetical protein